MSAWSREWWQWGWKWGGGDKGRPFIQHEVVILFIFLRICNRTLITNNQSDDDSLWPISQCQLTFSASDNDYSYLAAHLNCLLQKATMLRTMTMVTIATAMIVMPMMTIVMTIIDNRDDSDDSYLPPHKSSLLQTPPHLFPNKLVASQGLQNPEHGQLGE